MRSGIPPVLRRLHMQWQTPTATVLRFGFEITMYVGAR
jgi:coenzyme PQQ precursor peptide PqqA